MRAMHALAAAAIAASLVAPGGAQLQELETAAPASNAAGLNAVVDAATGGWWLCVQTPAARSTRPAAKVGDA